MAVYRCLLTALFFSSLAAAQQPTALAEQLEPAPTEFPPATVYVKTCQAITSCCTEKVGAGGRCMIYNGCQSDYDWSCGNETGHPDPDWAPVNIARGSDYNMSLERPTDHVEQDGVHKVEVDEDGCIWLDGELMSIHELYRLEEFVCIRWDGLCTWECAMWVCTNSQRCKLDKSGKLYTDIEPEFPGDDKSWRSNRGFDDGFRLSPAWNLVLSTAILLAMLCYGHV